MLTRNYEELSEDYRRVEQAILFLRRNYHSQPSLEEMATSVGLSEYHFQRLFSRWVGISPKRFLQFLTKENAKKMLAHSNDLLNAAYASGLSSPGRLHDLFVACEAVTPGEFKSGGEGLTIHYSFEATPFGECLLATTGRGICGLSFTEPGGRAAALDALRRRWPHAAIAPDPEGARPLVGQIFALWERPEPRPLSLYLKGTNFQIKVWEALLRIPSGRVVSYEDIAAAIGEPRAVRAVGSAIARNPIPLIIPCHRVIRKMGDFGNYQSGTARKMAILGWEMARSLGKNESQRITL